MNQKLDVARVFERIFAIYKDQFTLLIPAALVVFVPVALISGLIYAGDVSIIGGLIVAAIATIATYWFQGMVVEAARDILDGRRDYSVGSLVQSVTPVIGPLIIAGILAGVGIGIGLLLLIVPGLFLLTIWAVIAPVIVLERLGAIDSFGRSRDLVRGHGWQVFSVIVVLFLLQFIITAVLNAIANSVSDSFVGYTISDLIVRVLVAPFTRTRRGGPVLRAEGAEGRARAGHGRRRPDRTDGAAGAPSATPEAPPRAPSAADYGPEGTGSEPPGDHVCVSVYAERIHGPGRAASARKRSASSRPTSFCPSMRSSLAARIASGSKSVKRASASSHPSSQSDRFSRVTSAWNWSPQAGFPSMRKAWTDAGVRASSTAPGGSGAA